MPQTVEALGRGAGWALNWPGRGPNRLELHTACRDITMSSVYRSSLVSIVECVCRPRTACLTKEEAPSGNEVVFVRSGSFVRHVGSRRVVADPTTMLFFNRGEGYRVSHPVPGGDNCITMATDDETLFSIMAEHGGGGRFFPDRPFRVDGAQIDPETALLQRRLMRFVPFFETLELDEFALRLLASAVRVQRGNGGLRPWTSPSATRRQRIEQVKLIAASHFREKILLRDLAREVSYSPYHLCRVFKEDTGVSINRYINRLRLLAALDSLDSNSDLSALAHDLGFSSHSHFSTAFKREFGQTPVAVRQSLTLNRVGEMRAILGAGNGYSATGNR